LAARLPQGCDLLAVDHYGRGHDFERACRRFARRILVIDDLADRRHDCDILLDQNAADESAYRSLTPPHCRRLLGPTFALLRADFARRRPAALARRKSNTVERLLISCGLTDIQDLTGRALAAIAASALAVDVVVGPDTPNLGAVRDLAAARAAPTTLHVGTDAMAELMAAADLAIGAAGSSSWERCCLGLPAILAVAADNQNVVARRLVASGASLILGLAESVTPAGIAAAIAKLSADSAARRRMSAAGAALCDGLGVGRVAAAVAALSAGD
jgi:UDP-2,4-diacetamido-2,4,6-trideoxy-beta-L-altropyranose hydrolase